MINKTVVDSNMIYENKRKEYKEKYDKIIDKINVDSNINDIHILLSKHRLNLNVLKL